MPCVKCLALDGRQRSCLRSDSASPHWGVVPNIVASCCPRSTCARGGGGEVPCVERSAAMLHAVRQCVPTGVLPNIIADAATDWLARGGPEVASRAEFLVVQVGAREAPPASDLLSVSLLPCPSLQCPPCSLFLPSTALPSPDHTAMTRVAFIHNLCTATLQYTTDARDQVVPSGHAASVSTLIFWLEHKHKTACAMCLPSLNLDLQQ